MTIDGAMAVGLGVAAVPVVAGPPEAVHPITSAQVRAVVISRRALDPVARTCGRVPPHRSGTWRDDGLIPQPPFALGIMAPELGIVGPGRTAASTPGRPD